MRQRPAERTPHQQSESNTLDTSMLPRWLSVNQIRKMQRCRRETVKDAMDRGELPFEQRGNIRYARLSDVIRWEERRLQSEVEPVRGIVHKELEEFA